ncbi:adenosylcobinamide-phosphate synthase CbiB [Roseovarius sp. Pro17]|uniref:adenosylcobinamide-phosphate synthase CbiB n=1 Tax=Roseovarius sp. Pro17 TaxID=3108175 RepID=UPI002D76DA8E|nr:adenosylcobinamide-phosphate synthase CbiB [Roseovarius sp. Pro17]
MSIPAILALAMLLDAALGEPRWLWSRLPHPAVLMGRAIDALDMRLNAGAFRRAKGVLAVAMLAVGALTIGVVLAQLGTLIVAIAAAILIAQRSLVDHVAAVAAGLRQSTEAGRSAVAMIVGRDTNGMDQATVTRAAIESASENFSDGVIAPLFWLAIAGLPGLVLYKTINTADSMIGHRTARHAQFGWAAARLDDVMNFVPARASAALIALLARPRPRWQDIASDARQHRSPNGGWPEATMARSIGVALSGPRAYAGQTQDYPFVNPAGLRRAGPAQIDAAITVLWRAWGAVLILATLAALLV